MPYIDKQYMTDRFGTQPLIELTDRAEPYVDAIVDTVLDAAIESADGIVNGYVSNRYKTPLTPVPPIIKRATADIAYYDLHRGRYTDEVSQAHKDAMKLLSDISTGKAHLSVDGDDTKSATADARVQAPERTFSRESLGDF